MAKILCIDDEEYIREDISEYLESTGHTLFQAGDGNAGLEAILNHEPDLVLCDITMPNMSGTELLVELRKNHLQFADMPFIFLSALAERIDVLEGIKLGADDYLTKPLDLEMLDNRVTASLRQVERMNAMKDQQFVKLFNALSGGSGTEKVPENQAEWETVKSAARSELERTGPVTARPSSPQTAEADNKRKIFGTIFRFDNFENYQNCDADSDGQDILSWLENKSMSFLERVLPKTVSLTKIPNGGILICFQDGDIFKVAKESKHLARKLQDHLKSDRFDELVRITTVSKDLLYELLTISRTDYETEISKDDLNEPDKFAAAIKEQIDEYYSNTSLPEKLAQSITQNNGHLSPLALLKNDDARVPISFFDYDEISRQKIKTSFALFGHANLAQARFHIDLLTLSQLGQDITKYKQIDTVVVDVHFETISSDGLLAMYLPEFLKFVKSTHMKILINVLRLPTGKNNQFLDELLSPFGEFASRRIIQIPPLTIEAHANSDILAAGIAVSYFELLGSQLNPSFFHNAKRKLSKHGILLILRSLPSKEKMAQFSDYGFDGYAIGP